MGRGMGPATRTDEDCEDDRVDRDDNNEQRSGTKQQTMGGGGGETDEDTRDNGELGPSLAFFCEGGFLSLSLLIR